jgi:hypothetical protein
VAIIKLYQRSMRVSGVRKDSFLVTFYFLGNTFQNLRVSSPAPVTIEVPSGLIAR